MIMLSIMWEQVKWAMVKSAWLSENGWKNPKIVWWNDDVKTAVRKKKAVWKKVLAASKRKMHGSLERKQKGVYIKAKRK